MPWCPECKAEYVDGYTTCTSCGVPLVESLEAAEETLEFLDTKKEAFAKKFVEFLLYSNVGKASYYYKEADDNYVVVIDKKDQKQVKKLYDAFYSVEAAKTLKSAVTKGAPSNESERFKQQLAADDEATEEAYAEAAYEDASYADTEDFISSQEDVSEENLTDDDISEEEIPEELFAQEEVQGIFEGARPPVAESATYVKKEEQYKDLSSSAVTFLIVSIAGLILLGLNIAGVISIFSGALSYIVMGAVFIAFLIIGITTYTKSKQVEKQISEENTLTDTIEEWLDATLSSEKVQELADSSAAPEVQFLQKVEKMKLLVTEHFGEMDELYLDRLVEEYYNDRYEKEFNSEIE